MLHLSFTQQLCHVEKIADGEAANDAIFGLSTDSNDSEAAAKMGYSAQKEKLPIPYLALRQLAQRCLKNKS